MVILKNLKTPKYLLVAVGIAFIAFDISYYLMATLPGSRNEMCIMGANMTAGNISYSLSLSVLIGILIAGLIALGEKRLHTRKKLAVTSLSGLGAGIGVMTIFCTACTLPVISLFGLSVTLEFFTYNNITFKVVSLVMMLYSIYMLNRQLNDKCERCVPEKVNVRD
jgi:hypothetical protein